MQADTGDKLLDSLANYLQDQGLATIGTNLFVHSMPAKVTSGYLLVNNIKGAKVHKYYPGWRDCVFRIIARGVDRPIAIGNLNTLLPYLQFDETQLDTVFIKHIRYDNDPIVFPVSYNSEMTEASVQLTAIYTL